MIRYSASQKFGHTFHSIEWLLYCSNALISSVDTQNKHRRVCVHNRPHCVWVSHRVVYSREHQLDYWELYCVSVPVCAPVFVFLTSTCGLLPQIFCGMLIKHSALHLNRPRSNITLQGIQTRGRNFPHVAFHQSHITKESSERNPDPHALSHNLSF